MLCYFIDFSRLALECIDDIKRVIGAKHVDPTLLEVCPQLGTLVLGDLFVDPDAHYLIVVVKPLDQLRTNFGRLNIAADLPGVGDAFLWYFLDDAIFGECRKVEEIHFGLLFLRLLVILIFLEQIVVKGRY